MAEAADRRKNAIWRLMRAEDIGAVFRIASVCHSDLPERAAVLAEKQRLAPQCCFALSGSDTAAGGGAEEEVLGYLLAHPWVKGDIPALDCLLRRLPPRADMLYLHDLALSPAARGRGLAEAAAFMLCARAAETGFAEIHLVAVHDSAPFWRKQGFAPQPAPGEKLLKTYGADAVFMVKRLFA